QRVRHLQRDGAQLRRRGDQRRPGGLRPLVHRVRARHHEGGDHAPRRFRARFPHRADGRRVLHRHRQRDGDPGLPRAAGVRVPPMRWLVIVLVLLAGCSRGPNEEALKAQVQERMDKSFKPGLLELAGLKRLGSSPLPSGEGGAERVLVYYNATLRLKEGYDFKDWEALSPATLAQVLGAREKGVIGVKAKENQPGDLLRVYGTGTFERAGERWTAVAAATRDVSPAPADPGNAASPPSSKRYLDRLASVVDVGPPGIDPQSDAIISEELDQALRAIARRRARTQEIVTVASGPASGEYMRVVEAVLANLSKGKRK